MVQFQGLVEVADTLRPDQRREFVRRAFRASVETRAPIGLVLKGVDRDEVDQVLDSLVEEHGHRGPIVYYLDYADTPNLLQAAERSRFVVAVSDEFKDSLQRQDIGFVEAGTGSVLPLPLDQGAA